MKYRIKFEFYGRKMQTDIDADTEEKAKAHVRNRLNFVSVTIAEGPFEWDFMAEMNKIMSKK